MLIRISGKLTTGQPFSYRVEAESAVQAVADFAKKSEGKGLVSEVRAVPMGVAEEVYFGEIKTPEQIAEAKSKRAARKAAKAESNGVSATAPTAAAQTTPKAATVRR